MAKKIVQAKSKHKLEDIYKGEYRGVALHDFIENLTVIESELELAGWRDLNICIDVDGYDYDDSGELRIEITGLRPETDQEEAKRIKAEQKAAELKAIRTKAREDALKRKEDAERSEYERLKAKYEEVDRNPNRPGKLGDC